MNLKVGDKVIAIAGASRGKEGKVLQVLRAEDRVVVEGLNMIKKHVKPNGQQAGSIVEKEAPIHISNVKLVEGKTKEVTKVKADKKTDKKVKAVRTTKKSNEDLK